MQLTVECASIQDSSSWFELSLEFRVLFFVCVKVWPKCHILTWDEMGGCEIQIF